MICKFTCNSCAVEMAEFEVRSRASDEEIGDWLGDAVQPAMRAAHARLSPLCGATTGDLYVPHVEGRNLGAALH